MKAGKRAGASENYPHLPAMQPLTVEIEEVEYKESTFNGKKSQKAHVRMRVIEGPYAGDGTDKNPAGKVWGNHLMTMNKRKGGKRSQLSELVVAARPDLVQGKSEEDAQAALEDFDLDHLKGARLIVVGRYNDDDQDQQYLTPIGYSSLPSGMNRVTQTATTTATATASAEGYQISPDGKYRWKPGMAQWEPVPASAPPPPPPVDAAPPLPTAPPPPPSNGATAQAPERAKVEF